MKFIKVSNIKINVDESVDKAFEKAIKEAGINNKDIIEQKIVKYSIDARHKDSIKQLYTIGFKIKTYNKHRKNVVVLDREPEYEFVP
ncbi:MAG: FAD-dependent oxidoreductase, partial [Eubacterium ventriosum]